MAKQHSIVKKDRLLDREILKHQLLHPYGLTGLYHVRVITVPFTISNSGRDGFLCDL